MRTRRSPLRWPCVGLSIVALVALSACGSSSKSTSSSATTSGAQPTALSLSIAESGKTAAYTTPTSATGGFVTISLTNKGSNPHGAQFVLILGNHSTQQALQTLGGGQRPGAKTPSWLRAEGGPPSAPPGQTTSATQNLPPGKYVIADIGGPSNGPPPYTQLTVTGGTSAATLPSTPATITAATAGKDKYKWEFAGAPPKTGGNHITFVSKGHNAFHVISAFRVTGHPSKQQLIKVLNSNGPPPSFVDQSSPTSTAAIDGGKSQVTTFTFSKPGTWVIFCPVHDRTGGKRHYEEGLLRTITVQ